MTIHAGDCVEVMAAMDAESIDAIVTDPPYLIQFMGKEWDGPGKTFFERKSRTASGGFDAIAGNHHPTSQADVQRTALSQGIKMQSFHQQWATEALRVAKPGAYLLAFGGTRTVHRLTVALEDAGWIIRDLLVWAYAQGFPKSKSSLKPAWEPIVLARKPGPLAALAIDECRLPTEGHGGGASGSSGFAQGYQSGDGFATNTSGRWPANVILTSPIFDGGWEGVEGGGETGRSAGGNASHIDGTGIYGSFGGGLDGRDPGYGDTGTYSRFFLLPRGDDECQRCGRAISAAQSFAHDDGPVATAPSGAATSRDGTQASTGNGSRARPQNGHARTTSATESESSSAAAASTPSTLRSKPRATSPESAPESSPAKSSAANSQATGTTTTTAGPSMCATCAEAITSDSTRLPVERPDYTRFLLIPKASRSDREPDVPGLPTTLDGGVWGGDEDDLTEGKKRTIARQNTHPTVKPTRLMRHLIRLVTPEGGTVLDPFLGSGTTAKAAVLEGVEWIGIEREPEYIRIAEQRLVGLEPEPEQMQVAI